MTLLLASLQPRANDGVAHYQNRRFTQAEQSLRHILGRNPRDASTRLYLARTLIELNRTPEALLEIEKLLAGQASPEVRFQAGRILRELAERRFARLRIVAPDSAPTLELAGARWERAGNLDEALEQYRTAASLSPGRPGVHYLIGNILWRKRELEAATEALQRELALAPHHGMASLRLGEILLTSNLPEAALSYLKRAVSALPESVEARRELGKAYRKTGRLDEARAEWEAIAKVHPQDVQVHYLLADVYRQLGESALAKRELELHRAILGRRRQESEQR